MRLETAPGDTFDVLHKVAARAVYVVGVVVVTTVAVLRI
jgi:hypothetical protein